MIDARPLESDRYTSVFRQRKRWLLFALPLTFTVYELTSVSLTVKSGIIYPTAREIRLYKVKKVQLTRSYWQRVFGLASIKIGFLEKSGDEEEHIFLVVENIKKYAEFNDYLCQYVKKENGKSGM